MFWNLENILMKDEGFRKFYKKNTWLVLNLQNNPCFNVEPELKESSKITMRNKDNLSKRWHDFETKGLKDWDIWNEWITNMLRLTVKLKDGKVEACDTK